MSFWNTIVQTNTFNFAVLLLIFAVLYKKLNVSNMIEKIKQDIIDAVDAAKSERERAKQKLSDAQKEISHLDDEIKERLENAETRAKGLVEQIEDNARAQIQLIEKNIEKVIGGEEKTLSAQMSEKTLKSAIDLAKEQIINTLKKNPKLHDRYIEESLGKI